MKTFPPTSSTRTPARSSGFTVIEVLVALVILLIGGLAIMNLFPPALNVVKGSENREVAMAQVKGTLARYSSDPASIPDAVYDNTDTYTDPSTNQTSAVWTDLLNAAVEGSRSRNTSLPTTPLPNPPKTLEQVAEDNFNASALGHFKHIVGERHKVIFYTDTTVTPSVTRSFVLLNHAYYYRTPDSTKTPNPGIRNPKVSTAETIEGARVDENGKLNFADAVYASDGAPLPTPLQAGIYYASYSWQNTVGGPLQSIVDELVDMTPLPDPITGAVNIKVFQSARVVAGPIDMKVFFPKLLPPTIPPVNADAPFRGFLPVDPALQGKEVVVDYDVLDWRWLVEDTNATVPTSKNNPPLRAPAPVTARDVKLSVPFLGKPQSAPVLPFPVAPVPDAALYALVMPAPDASGQLSVDARGGKWTGTAGVIGTDVVLDVNSASATYDIAVGPYTSPPDPVPMTAPRVRTSYWASHGWAQQLSVAASSYYVFDGKRPKGISEKWREFYWRPLNNDGTPSSNSGRLYFHSSEAGKTIMVSFTNGTTKYANQIVTIGSRFVPAPSGAEFPNMTTPAAAGNEIFTTQGLVAVAELIDGSGNPIPADALTSVRGVSVRARTAWQQGSDYTQEVAEMYRPLN